MQKGKAKGFVHVKPNNEEKGVLLRVEGIADVKIAQKRDLAFL